MLDYNKINQLKEKCKEIECADKIEMEKATRRWNSLAKPLGSLGRLEEAVIKLAGIRKNYRDVAIKKPALVIMCGDHGVVKEGVTQTDSSVTKIVAEGFTCGQTSAAIMSKAVGADIFPIDIGMVSEPYPEKNLIPFTLIDRKIARGTKNIVKEPAMTTEQCVDTILTGIEIVADLKQKGYDLIATGEMGIGNTTPSSALTSVLLKIPAEAVTGRGAGLSNDGLEKKVKAVKSAIKRYHKECLIHTEEHLEVWKTEDIIELTSHLGGFDILGITGLFLGGAIYKMPVIIDGFISAAAAICAVKIAPYCIDYIFASHLSKEPAGSCLIDALGLKACLTCEMCLGEGTGAIAVIPILRLGIDVYTNMRTFQDAEIDDYIDYEHKTTKL